MPVTRLALVLTFGLSVASASTVERPREFHITIPRRTELTPVQKLNRDGVDAVLKRHYEKAEGLFFKAYLFDPADPFTLNNLGYVSELQGQVDRAEKFYQLAQEQGCDAEIETSTSKDLKGKPMMDALGSLQNIPMRVNRINVLGMGLLAQGRGFEAITVFKQALALDAKNPFTLNNLGVASEATGDLENAINYYDEAAASHSMQPVVVTLKKSWRGRPVSKLAAESAQDVRTRMAGMNINQVRATMYAIRGVAAVNANDWDSAKKDFVEAYNLDPESAFALNNYGYVAEHDGELEIARSYYARAQSARDAGAKIGVATQAAAQGQNLDTIADESHHGVDAELDAYSRQRLGQHGLIKLKTRDGRTFDPDAKPTTPSDTSKPPADTSSPGAGASSLDAPVQQPPQ